ncbi:MAG TPA: glycyl-radical enzyme activating protein [Desulfosporosinus sp.]|nr:glycyl-radical enzyme activating protein [Desulfosporosinus sp.]
MGIFDPDWHEVSALVTNIQRFSVNDGPGIRTTVFLKGCNLHCCWCHNPECINMHPQTQFDDTVCQKCDLCSTSCPNGAIRSYGNIDQMKCVLCGCCVKICPYDALSIVGERKTSSELLETMKKDRPYYQESGGGVTISGGEPLLQLDFLHNFLPKLKQENFHVVIDTAGCVPFSSLEYTACFADLFLFDVKAFSPEIHKKYTGADNAVILENLRRLSSLGTEIWVRIPIIAGINDTQDEIAAIARFLSETPGISQVDLLPFHDYGVKKYESIGKPYLLRGDPHPSDDFMLTAKRICSSFCLPLR